MTWISDSLAVPGTVTRTRSRARLSRDELSRIAAGAARADRWRDLVRYDPARRWSHRMELTSEYEVWLLSWEPGQGTGFHDHGGSCGAFAVAAGELQEHTVRGRRDVAVRTVRAGGVHSSARVSCIAC